MKFRTAAILCLVCATAFGCDAAGEDAIGPEGGTVVSRDGRLILEIPEGALDANVEITIEQVDDLPEDALGPAYEVLPVGTVFSKPATVYYDYGAQGMDVEPQAMSLVVERSSDWSELADRQVHADDDVIAASALYLSTFCVVGD